MWKLLYPDSNGGNQSPINVTTQLAVVVQPSEPLRWSGYDKGPLSMTITNNENNGAIFHHRFNNQNYRIIFDRGVKDFFLYVSFFLFLYIYSYIYIIPLFEHFVTRSRCILFPVVLNTMWSNTTRPYIQGGCLTSVYDLCSMVFHWGHSNEEGSEHTFDYVRFPMELQVWHIKRGFNSLLDAITAKENDGILIVSFFFQVQSLFFSFI